MCILVLPFLQDCPFGSDFPLSSSFSSYYSLLFQFVFCFAPWTGLWEFVEGVQYSSPATRFAFAARRVLVGDF